MKTSLARSEDERETGIHYPVAGRNGVGVDISDFSLWYGEKQALYDVSLKLERGLVTALIGPSGCGKSTLLRSLNRMNDLVEGMHVSGKVTLDGEDIYAPDMDVIRLRKSMGMVFQKPNPFPMSIFANVAYPLRIDGIRDRKTQEGVVMRALQGAALWDEVKDRLHESALGLSGGQQQRLCIARAIAGTPDILLMDEPCSALDPIATAKIEELIGTLAGDYTIVIVTHNMQQAARVSDNTAFMYLGRLVEYGETSTVFTAPKSSQTLDYVTGRFG